MPRWQRSIDVDAPASATWDLVGDPTSVPRWYTKYETADVSGGQRILRNADGGELVETLDDRDDAARRYSYSVISGAPVSSLPRQLRGAGARGRQPGGVDGGGRARATPRSDIEARLGPTQAEALQRMKEIVESGG